MGFNASKFLLDYKIDHIESGNKHCKRGWVNVHCPFCEGSRDYHLGVNLIGGYGNCWRCKGKSLPAVVQALTQCSWAEAYKIVKLYGGRLTQSSKILYKTTGFDSSVEVELPGGCGPLTKKHKNYLEGRDFDADWLEEMYDLKGTGPVGDYKHRIIAPITWDGNLVSYQGRDVTGKSGLKYKACCQDDEAMDHKNTLYGIDIVKGQSVIVVEGIADAWRLGPGSVATFGTSFKPTQVRMLKERFTRIFLLYDSEKTAQANARILAVQLASMGKEVEILHLDQGDPGEMSQDDADNLMREVGLQHC